MKDEVTIRILIVENATDYALSRRDILLNEGLIVDVAFGPEEAASKVDTNLYDLCIVGHRLQNRNDVHDRSGIDLIKNLAQRDKALRFIFNPFHPDAESIRELMSPENDLHVLNCISAAEGPKPIIETVRELQKALSASLREVFRDEELPPALTEVLHSINIKLIQALKESPLELYQIPPNVFEELVAELLAHYGWKVDVTKQTRDDGYDIFAIRKDISGMTSSWIIECKRYRGDRKIGVDVARSLYSVKSDLRVGMSMLATTSWFSKDVYSYKASRYDLELRDFAGIMEWINQYRPHPGGKLYMKDNKLIIPGDPEWKNPQP